MQTSIKKKHTRIFYKTHNEFKHNKIDLIGKVRVKIITDTINREDLCENQIYRKTTQFHKGTL